MVDLRLQPEAISLSEIVVTGVAGATQRTKLPFDVAQVRVADLPVPSMNAAQSIQGRWRASGGAGQRAVRVQHPPSSSGASPASTHSGRSQEPLYIVDGVILGAALVDLDALDIQSIEVVKGAAAASLYGSRAANGVIQIRTKRGAEMADDQIRYTLPVRVREEQAGRTTPGRPPDGSPRVRADPGREPSSWTWTAPGCDWLACSSPVLAGQTANGGTPTSGTPTRSTRGPVRPTTRSKRFFEGGNTPADHLHRRGSLRTDQLPRVRQQPELRGGILRYEPGFERNNFRVNVDQAVVENLTRPVQRLLQPVQAAGPTRVASST